MNTTDRNNASFAYSVGLLKMLLEMQLITKEEFKEFGKTARAERKKCYNGEITLEQFQTWLDDFR